MSRLSTGYREKHSISEKRMLRVSFTQVTEADPLGLRRKYKVGKDDTFLSHFYTVFSLIPIGLVLGALFYGLFAISPKTQNLKVYQQDIFNWNENKVAEEMEKYEF